MATRKQIDANRRNGKKGGPKTPAGKAVSRLNARKHGIFATVLTEYDSEELRGVHEEFARALRPVGPIEGLLVEKIAHTYVRLQRCARAEGEYHRQTWEPSEYDRRRARERGEELEYDFNPGSFARSVAIFGRYDRTLTNQLIQLLHEFERLQRKREGEQVAPPVAADLAVHGDAELPSGGLLGGDRSSPEDDADETDYLAAWNEHARALHEEAAEVRLRELEDDEVVEPWEQEEVF